MADRQLKATLLTQIGLQIGHRPDVDDVSDIVLLNKPDFLSAICLCMDISGLQDDHIASVLEMQPAQFSKCRSGLAHFPPNKLTTLMDVCQNIVPLRWLSIHRGFELKVMTSSLQKENDELKKQVEELDHDLETIKKFIKETT